MRAVILAAGRGSRLGSLTQDQPKCLLKHRGRKLLCEQIDALSMGGVSVVAAVAGYRWEQVAAEGIPVFLNSDWATTGIFHSLSKARRWLVDGPVIVSYGDIFYSAETVARLANSDRDLAISYDPDWLRLWSQRSATPLDDAEAFRVSNNGLLTKIGGKISTAADASGQYMGLIRTSPRGWHALEQAAAMVGDRSRTIDMTSILSQALAGGCEIEAIQKVGAWGEVDTAEDLALYERG